MSSNRFYRKALQFIWYIRDPEQEILVYDKLGQNYFTLGNIEKAKYYHLRSVNSLKESVNSPIRAQSQS